MLRNLRDAFRLVTEALEVPVEQRSRQIEAIRVATNDMKNVPLMACPKCNMVAEPLLRNSVKRPGAFDLSCGWCREYVRTVSPLREWQELHTAQQNDIANEHRRLTNILKGRNK